MEKLPVFQSNEVKNFKFSIEQYVCLEMEYNRLTIYKDVIKNIESLLKLNQSGVEHSNRKLYENKNIIDRFVLECINHGISPHLAKSQNNDINSDNCVDTNSSIHLNIGLTDTEDITLLSNYLFFNKILSDESTLKNARYFQKMISEYIEKKIKITADKVSGILKILIHANYRFQNLNNEINMNKKKPSYFNNIPCNIFFTDSENYIINYRNYRKMINFKRYVRLIKNYDRPFPYDILRMILRYAIFDMSNQQWSIGINLYEIISEQLDISFEMFASPLNFNMNMFCSLFLDTDKIFGSVGSFYNLTIDKLLNMNLHGVFFNPPYLPILMNNTTKICIDILGKMEINNVDFTVVSFLPNWFDADYIKEFLQSKYLVFKKEINKGDYILHEKDKGKLIRGTFDLLFIVMNSKIKSWDDSRSISFETTCKNIVKIMKDETLTKNIEK